MTEDLQKRLISDLVTESNEGLDEFDQELLLLEKGDASDETLNRIFRVIHSLKGTSGCLGLSRIEALAHAGENLLSLLRDGKIKATPEMVSTLLAYSDALGAMLMQLGTDGVEGGDDHAALLRDLRALAEGVANKEATPEAAFGLFEEDFLEISQASESEAPVVSEARVSEAKPAPPAAHTVTDAAIRVDIEQLDGLMDLVDELVLARNQIMQFTSRLNESALLSATQRLR